MDAWILSFVICSTTPQPLGDDCRAAAVAFGLTRQECRVKLARDKQDSHNLFNRLECFRDPVLSAQLKKEALAEKLD